jgi:alcohol dehydrogenase
MKAIVLAEHGSTSVLKYQDVPLPRVGPNEVLFKVKATGANFVDVWARKGMPGQNIIFPHISGSDAAGIVEEIGSEVTHVSAGDEIVVHPTLSCRMCEACARGNETLCKESKVWGFQTGPHNGGQAQYAVVPKYNVIQKLSRLTWEEAGSINLVLLTAWRMLVHRAKVKPGDHVLIWGAAGGVGTMAIQICRLFNAIPVAVVGSEEKLRRAHELGAAHLIDRHNQDVGAEIRRITERKGVDIVIEHTGQQTFPTSIRSLKWGGTLVTCGATTGFDASVDIRQLWNRQLQLLGSHMGNKSDLLEALRYVERGEISPVISHILPLEEVARGHDLIENASTIGKIVYIPTTS